jgi:hypothetical protein
MPSMGERYRVHGDRRRGEDYRSGPLARQFKQPIHTHGSSGRLHKGMAVVEQIAVKRVAHFTVVIQHVGLSRRSFICLRLF